MKKITKNKALKKVIDLIGSQSELARQVGVTQQTVFNWLKKQTPAKRVLQIEKLTKGVVTRYELRPDIYPRE